MIKSRLRRMEALLNRLAVVMRALPAPPPRQLQTAKDVIDLLQEQARALGYLAGVARKAIETGDLEVRLEKLEAKAKQ
jgi:hypothetical protein